MLNFQKYIGPFILRNRQTFSLGQVHPWSLGKGPGVSLMRRVLLLLLLLTLVSFQTQAQPPCTIEFSQCPGETTILACPNSPNGFTLYSYPPVSAYLAGSCPVGATVVVQQTAGPTLPAQIPAGGYLIQYHAFLYVNGQPTGQSKLCSFQLFVVDDNQPPVFTYCPPSITVHGTLDNNGNCMAIGQWPQPIFTDNCGPNGLIPGGLEVNIPCGSTLGAGTHTITYTAYDGTFNTASCSFTVTVLCPSSDKNPDINYYYMQLYPNPSPGLFTLELPYPAPPQLRYRLLDLTGRAVQEGAVQTGGTREMIDAGSLPNGMYFLQVLSGGQLLGVERLVKQ